MSASASQARSGSDCRSMRKSTSCSGQAALERFLEDAGLPVHNNASENALRREVVGRKN
jgi:transposase IS66 family protein